MSELLPCPLEVNMKEIVLTKGKRALVSDEDYEYLSQWKWYASQTGNKFYAARSEDRNGVRKVIYMHREIMKATEEDVDHIDGDGLNNVRENLRFAEHHQNLKNQRKQDRETSSRYKGVYLDKGTQTWNVQIKDRSRVRVVHGIESEDIAAQIYDLLAIDRFGEYANLNFPDSRHSKYPLAPVSSTLDRLLNSRFDMAAGAEADLGEIEHKGEKVTVKIKVVREGK